MKRTILILLIPFVAALICAGAMLQYRARAIHYERQWSGAMEQLAALNTPRPRAERAVSQRATETRPSGDVSDLHLEQDRLISDLLAELEQRERHIADLEQRTGEQRRPPSPDERRQQLETLRETDPERYAEIMARQEAFRERMQESFAGRAAVLLAEETASMSESEARQYEQMMNTLQQTWDLADRLTSPDTPPEERRATRDELAELSQELRPMLTEERTRRLVQLGLSSGYSPEEAQVFSDYIQQTFEATSMQRLPGLRGGPRPPGR